MTKKEGLVLIRCSEETRKRFRHFVVEFGFENYEKALEELLKIAETNPKLVKVRWG
jgi:hypothetical protein